MILASATKNTEWILRNRENSLSNLERYIIVRRIKAFIQLGKIYYSKLDQSIDPVRKVILYQGTKNHKKVRRFGMS